MPRRKMSPAEQRVGRHLPKDATYLDQLMAGFVKEDGTASDRMTPSDSWLKPAHKKARQKGWIRASPLKISIMGSKPIAIWYPTETGLEEAKAARLRVQEARERRQKWNEDFMVIHRAAKAEREERAKLEKETPLADVKPEDVPCPWK